MTGIDPLARVACSFKGRLISMEAIMGVLVAHQSSREGNMFSMAQDNLNRFGASIISLCLLTSSCSSARNSSGWIQVANWSGAVVAFDSSLKAFQYWLAARLRVAASFALLDRGRVVTGIAKVYPVRESYPHVCAHLRPCRF